jgi:hypothetical protein
VSRPRFALVLAIVIASLAVAPQALATNTIGVKVTTKPKSASRSTTAASRGAPQAE